MKFNPPSGEISPDYRQHFRDIRFNLGKNRQLLGDLLYGEVSGARVAAMSTEEMMSDDLKKEVTTVCHCHVACNDPAGDVRGLSNGLVQNPYDG